MENIAEFHHFVERRRHREGEQPQENDQQQDLPLGDVPDLKRLPDGEEAEGYKGSDVRESHQEDSEV